MHIHVNKLVKIEKSHFTKVLMFVTLTKTSKNTPLLIYHDYSYTIDRKSVTKILWKCEYSRKYSCHGRLHTTSNYDFIKTVGEHENHVDNSRCAATRKYFEKLKQESEQNHTNPHNILTQANIGVPDEVHVQLGRISYVRIRIFFGRIRPSSGPNETQGRPTHNSSSSIRHIS